jgi:protein-tyrosine kinase
MSRLKKALEKAKEARGDRPEDLARRADPAPPPGTLITSQDAQKDFWPLKPEYKSTRVVLCDSAVLRMNKVISICTEDEASKLKILRTQILNRISEEGNTLFLVTSANPGEGKTLTAINLAISFSHQLNKTVLLVDTDIRKPSIHKYFGLEDGPGLSDYLIGKAQISDVLVNPGIDRFVILPGGRPLTNSAELLGSPRMRFLLDELKQRYHDRFVILDSAPVLTSADPMVLSNFVDGILIVIEAEKTTRDHVRNVFEVMHNKPIIGTVLNKLIE